MKDDLLLSGSEAIALGALAGGCDYVCGYPMSPSTGVLERMAALSRTFDIVVEQVEDEIGVVNMALGAWYAGARALVTTSGGGFALMGEGISLCGMIESPLVLHLAQRPGPATGLPTRTEQGDLDLVLHAGHGDFPRVILAPGTLAEGFALTQKAFSLADRCQVPVFILTDQFFVDSRCNTPAFAAAGPPPEKHVVKTDPGYRRFALTADGISPRGIPGYGCGHRLRRQRRARRGRLYHRGPRPARQHGRQAPQENGGAAGRGRRAHAHRRRRFQDAGRLLGLHLEHGERGGGRPAEKRGRRPAFFLAVSLPGQRRGLFEKSGTGDRRGK